jgi:hypothetical protein
MPFDRTGTQPFHFDPDKLGKVKPKLAQAEGYTLSVDDLRDIFGIEAKHFGKLPKRLIVPILEGNWQTENWYQVTGNLYIVEPEAWVPQVVHRRTLPVSTFKTTHTNKQETVAETKFAANASAKVSISAGGSFNGVIFEAKAEAEASSLVSFDYSVLSTTTETLETSGVQGNEPVHQLFVYPLLRCKVIKKQRINYTINDSSEELKWTADSYKEGYWDAHWVAAKRMKEILQYAFDPVPMKGKGLGHKAKILPVPKVTATGELNVTTVMTRQGWLDWYVYDREWQTVTNNQKISFASPNNEVAFQPMATWTTIVSCSLPCIALSCLFTDSGVACDQTYRQ